MSDALAVVTVFALCGLAFAGLALTVGRHWGDLVDRRRDPPRRLVARLRVAAALCLAAALSVAVRHEGVGFGLLLWVLALSAAALAVAAGVTALTAGTATTRNAKPR
ncbi:DUF3325 family protein [Azospirillum griseum]|uniref:DUF3325 family protein n=1 Tax=Azospirillum griseum TaxID=2496639 RepID=A0A431VMD5_9PROT|nr:DUF3325 family protein [Azospirillum griseum]RTR22860.1 DUF3325 family protein [Azospirillum griseum]